MRATIAQRLTEEYGDAKGAEPDSRQSQCMAPLYDAVTTRVFPNLEGDRMALKINGKDDRLRRADFHALAATTEIRTADAESAIKEVASGLAAGLKTLARADVALAGSSIVETAERMRFLVKERLDAFT